MSSAVVDHRVIRVKGFDVCEERYVLKDRVAEAYFQFLIKRMKKFI